MAEPFAHHNQLVERFVHDVAGKTKSTAELMVVLESTMLSAMLVAVRVHGTAASVASGMTEVALQRATERMTRTAQAPRDSGR